MIEHYSLVNRLNWMQKQYPIAENDLILQKTPYTFDVSVWELFWWPLQGGARVCFLIPGGEKDPATIVAAIEKYQVTTIHFVPSMLTLFGIPEDRSARDRLRSLRQVFASGEALNAHTGRKFNELLNREFRTKM